MATAIDEKNLPKLREYLDSQSFIDKYFQLSRLINKFDSIVDIKQNLSVLKILYEDFLNEYPFNHSYWTKYASFYVKIQQNATALEIYDKAVSMNPTSPELWNNFISFVSQQYPNDTDKVIEVYERALKSIHVDINANVIWDNYINFLEPKDPERTHSLFWRILNHPISTPNEISQRYETFLSGLDHLQYQSFIEQRQDLGLPADAPTNKSAVSQTYSLRLKEASSLNLAADSEKKLHVLLEKTEFDGEDFDPSKEEALQNYLLLQEKVLNHEKLVYLYRKCLIIKCKSGEFWLKILHLLDKDLNTQKEIEKYFTIYERHFRVLENKEQVLFFQADFKEANREFDSCREIYVSLEQKKVFEAYLRHLYMEIRTNNIQNVVEIFVSLSQSVHDGDQIAFVIQEMGEILNKLGEVDRAGEIIKQFNEKKTEYSKFFFIAWINFLKNCKKPWEEIEAVFKLAFEKAFESKDKSDLWKVYVYSARSYCSDIHILREIERRFVMREEPTDQSNENGLNSKRGYNSLDIQDDENIEVTSRKQVKLD